MFKTRLFCYSLSKDLKCLATVRFAHYQINQTGEKVVISNRVNIKTKREKWQKVVAMEKEKKLKDLERIEQNDRLHSDSNFAQITATSKLKQLQDRLMISGFCREKIPYMPPFDLNEKFDAICQEFFPESQQQYDELEFLDHTQKFKFLVKCIQAFNHEIGNSDLFLMKSVGDVREYYATEVRGTNTYNQLAATRETPMNLHLISEPNRFNPESDNLFNGIDAFPGPKQEQVGLRAKKKFPTYKSYFLWPDV